MAELIEKGNDKYQVRVYLGKDESGKRKFHIKTIKGKKKAEKHLREILHQKDNDTLVESGKTTVEEHFELWLDSTVKDRVSDRTLLDYKEKVKLHINPAIGNIRLDKLNTDHLDKMFIELKEKNLSPRSIRYIYTVLNSGLKHAVKRNKIYRNPAEFISEDLPKQKREEMKVLTKEQVNIFLDKVKNSRMGTLFLLLVSSGMRPSEALGLKWSDVDHDNCRVTINRKLTRTDNSWKLEEPKTSKSRRTIPLPKQVIEDLKGHQKEQAEYILKCKPGKYNNQDLVFTALNGEPLCTRNVLMRHFKPLLKEAGLPDIRLYDLRHTCATLLLQAGINPKVVSERLGHSSIVLTLDTYSHVLPDMQEEASNKLETILFK
jgi:integrase